MAQFGFGQAMRRSEDVRLITGAGRYTDDISLPGQTFAYFLRSPMAHATITALNVDDARGAEGVLAVLTAADLAADGLKPLPCYFEVKTPDNGPYHNKGRPLLADGTVRYVGEPIAVVIAESIDAAKDAADLIELDLDPLPVVVDTAGALQPGVPQVWDDVPNNTSFDWWIGDKDKADALFAGAARTVSVDIVNNRVIANSMEGRACLADYDTAADAYTIYVSSQGVHGLRKKLAKDILGIDEDKLHVMTTDVGGGFGMKIFNYPEYAVSLAAAKRVQRPVKWTAERSEGFLSDDHGRDHVSRAEVALDAEGKFLALKVDTIANLGAYLSDFATFIPTEAGCRMLNGLYTFQEVHVRVRGVYTHTQPVDAYRGAGRPEAAYLLERLVDHAGRETGLGPVEIRKRNFIPPEAMPYATATGLTYDSGAFARNLDDAVRIADLDGLEARRTAALARGKLLGAGIASYVEACGGGGPDWAWIKVEKTGAVTVLSGSQSNGQGHETAYKQIIAEHLGVAPDDITVKQGDSKLIPKGSGTGGSRSIPVGGAAVENASLKIQEKAKELAADMLEAASADITFENGAFTVIGTDRSVTLSEIARQSAEDVVFDEGGEFKPPAATFPNGVHVCELEIDIDTGVPTVTRYTVVDDFGKVLNPLMLEGQVHGGVAQGLGQALTEHTVYDPESGQLLTGSFMDYTMPRADLLPFITFTYNEIPCTTNPLGVKGAGEAGAIGAPPAVINALVDALKAHGVAHVDMPATPEKLWRMIQSGAPAVAAE